jgi:hypothetical protein
MFGGVAQLVEQRPEKPCVTSSSLVLATTRKIKITSRNGSDFLKSKQILFEIILRMTLHLLLMHIISDESEFILSEWSTNKTID